MDFAPLRDPRVASRKGLRGYTQWVLSSFSSPCCCLPLFFQGWLSDGVHYLFKKIGNGGSLLIRCSLMSSKQCRETRPAFHLILCLTTTVILRRVGDLRQRIVADTGVRRAISDLFRGACTNVFLWRRMPKTKRKRVAISLKFGGSRNRSLRGSQGIDSGKVYCMEVVEFAVLC
jgi:hypothetical protein